MVDYQPPQSQEARTWGMLCHLSQFAGLFIPFGYLLGPLIVWLLKKDQHPFVDDQGKESLNFQLTMTIGYAIVFVLTLVLIGLLLLFPLILYHVIFGIIATIKANEGVAYRYPFTLRLIR